MHVSKIKKEAEPQTILMQTVTPYSLKSTPVASCHFIYAFLCDIAKKNHVFTTNKTKIVNPKLHLY